jgi:hypothetical protein
MGMAPSEFWGLTPYLTRHAITAMSDGRTMLAWMTACLSRASKLPKLDKLLSRDKEPEKVDLSMKFHRIFVAHNAALKAREESNG